jgi:hypothetical protein
LITRAIYPLTHSALAYFYGHTLYRMRKNISILICITCGLLLSLQSVAQNNNIVWSKKAKLKWTDFQGTPDTASRLAAFSKCKVAQNYGSEGNTILTYSVKCLFLRDQSWAKPGADLTKKLLKHEQKQFDLAEVCARKLSKEYHDYTTTHIQSDSTTRDMGLILRKALNDYKNNNDLYERETKQGTDKDKQKQWNKQIKHDLKKNKRFK